MRKPALLAATVAAALVPLAPSSAAPARPQVSDPSGDWVVPSADIVSARLSTVRARTRRGTVPMLRVELTLREAPAANVPQAYRVEFAYDGCERMQVTYYWSGGVSAFSDEAFVDASSCEDAGQVFLEPKLTDVPVRVNGTSVVWDVPLVHGMRVGTTIEAPSAHTSDSAVTRQFGGRYYLYAPGGDETLPGSDYVIGR
jgi:hypothetical protein